MAKQHFFSFGKYLGSRQIPDWTSIGPDQKIASSYLLVCPECAEVWGKIMHEHPLAFTQVQVSRCANHAVFPSEGTLSIPDYLPGFPRTLDEDWPLAAIQHDVHALSHFALTHDKEKSCQALNKAFHVRSSADQKFLSLVLPEREKPEVSAR